MSTTDSQLPPLAARPKRADARRNYDKVIAAARDAFAEAGAATSLEEIARRAGVGIGTLYRNFPNRQSLLEAVYAEEVAQLSASATELQEVMEPWDALATWLHSFVRYMATKQALAQELMEYFDTRAPLFQTCRGMLFAAGQPLLEHAQQAQAARPDTSLPEIIQMVGAVAKIPASEPGQIDHILDIAIDGLRYRP